MNPVTMRCDAKGWAVCSRKRKVEQQIVTTSIDTEGEQVTVEESTTEVTAPGGKKTRTKKVTVERGKPLSPETWS